MAITQSIKEAVLESLSKLYQQTFSEKDFQLSQTKPEFEGDYTVVLFSLVKSLKRSPDALGNELGEYLTKNYTQIFSGYNIIKGFLNLVISDDYWINVLNDQFNNPQFGKAVNKGQKVMIE